MRLLNVLTLAVIVSLPTVACEDLSEQPYPAGPDVELAQAPAQAQAPGQKETEIQLGDLGAGGTHALAINNRGQVVGHSLAEDGPWGRPFFWAPGEGMTDLGKILQELHDAPFPVPGQAVDINEAGVVVGWDELYFAGFVWSERAGAQRVGFGQTDLPMAINNRGTVVGLGEGPYFVGTEGSGGSEVNAFVCPKGETCHHLIDEEFIALTAHTVNERGQVGGRGAYYEPVEGLSHTLTLQEHDSYIWTQGQGFVVGEDLGDDNRSENDRGDYVAGGSLFTTAPARYGVRPETPSERVGPSSINAETAGDVCSDLVGLAQKGQLETIHDCIAVKKGEGEPSTQ